MVTLTDINLNSLYIAVSSIQSKIISTKQHLTSLIFIFDGVHESKTDVNAICKDDCINIVKYAYKS